jgi:hypothetical protein
MAKPLRGETPGKRAGAWRLVRRFLAIQRGEIIKQFNNREIDTIYEKNSCGLPEDSLIFALAFINKTHKL